MARDPEQGQGADQGDDRLMSRVLRERLGRYPASPRLRAALLQALEPEAARPRGGTQWLAPAISALATAVVTLFWVAGGLPTAVPGDTLRDLTRAVVTEHARTLSWTDAQPDVVSATLPNLYQSEVLVAIVPQRVPDTFVRTTVTLRTEERSGCAVYFPVRDDNS